MTTTPDRELERYAADHGLVQLGGRPPLRVYTKELWERRHFAMELARSRVRSQNEANRLGIAWVVLTPLVNVAVYGFVFGVLYKSSSHPAHFLPFLVCGVFTFQLFSGCFGDGAKAIVGNRGLVRTLHFPRAVLPISVVLQKMLELAAQVFVMCVIMILTGEGVHLKWLQLVPTFFLMSLFCAGVAFFAARLTIHVRDVTQLIPFITRLIFYVSGIFFVLSTRFEGNRGMEAFVRLNPISAYITLVRDSLLHRDIHSAGLPVHPTTWLVALAWAVVTLVLGFIFFWRAEGLYGRD